MPYSLEWVVEKRVLYSRIWGEQTLSHVQQYNVELKNYLETGIPLVHLIVDMQQMESMPRSLGALQGALQAVRHPNLGWFISVGSASSMSRYLGTMIVKMFRLRFWHAATLDEALAFLHSNDLTVQVGADSRATQPDA